MTSARPRVLILVVAPEAEQTIESVLARIPAALKQRYDLRALAFAGPHHDQDASLAPTSDSGAPPILAVLHSPVPLSYGQNQKLGFQYAIENGFDLVVLLHGAGKYAPESLEGLIAPILEGSADAVYGSRMLKPEETGGRMPFYKTTGNRILTKLQNWLLRSSLTEFHSGYRAYSVAALTRIPFQFNVNDLHFDTEMTIQLLLAGQRLVETPIPQYHSEDIGLLSGMRYAKNVIVTCCKARAQELSLFYDRKFDCIPSTVSNVHYKPRLGFTSTHTMTLELIPSGARVLDIGCAGGDLGTLLRARGCHVTGVDQFPLDPGKTLDHFHLHDLNAGPLPVDVSTFDYAVMLDVIEHLQSPERFVDDFRAGTERSGNVRLIVSSPNIAFVVSRLMLLAGQFNYGKRGILDLTHTRLFTFRTFKRLFEQSGYEVLDMRGVPAPFPLALGDSRWARALLAVHTGLIRISRSLFAFQIFAVVRPKAGLASLLHRSEISTGKRAS